MKLPVNTIMLADAYKYTHWLQIPEKTEYIELHEMARGSNIPEIDYTRQFGLQGFLKDYLEGRVIEPWMLDEADETLAGVFGTNQYFNRKGFQYIIDEYDGHIPLEIYSLDEGLKVPLKVVSSVIKTKKDKRVAWVGPWIETMLLRGMWYGKAVATISSAVKDLEREFAALCGAPDNPFFLNDFGARGVSSHESAEIGGTAHAVNYWGSDTVECLPWARNRYGKGVNLYSVFATEHNSTIIYTKEKELDAYTHFLKQVPKDKIASIVIDSYDPEIAVKELLGTKLKDVILERIAPTVFRPDSGDPVYMSLSVINWLWEKFGGTIRTYNGKDFKILNPKIKVIYGDGIHLNSIRAILQNLIDHGYSTENIIFGMGGKLLQSVDRDTFNEAMKAWYAIVNGQPVDIYKDANGKKSLKGRHKVCRIDQKLVNVPIENLPHYKDELKLRFDTGVLYNTVTMEDIWANKKYD